MLITSTYTYLISPLKFSFRTSGLKDNKEYQTSYKNVLQEILEINQINLKGVIFLTGSKDLVEDFLKEDEVVPGDTEGPLLTLFLETLEKKMCKQKTV